jgi:hypothetical protein
LQIGQPKFSEYMIKLAGSMTARGFDRTPAATYMLLTGNRVRTGRSAQRARFYPALIKLQAFNDASP